jgi:ABC-type transporter Mla subunit MlaD
LARTVNAFRVGLFALICLALVIGTIIWLVAASHFENTKTYACYFNESVTGLQKDAIINYRGVPIGRVDHIGLAPDGRLVEVLIKLKADFRVDDTIAIQLRAQGLTGLSYLDIDAARENIDQISPKITFPTKYPILKAQPSEMEQLKYALQDIYEKFSSVDLRGLTESWTKTSELLNHLLEQFGAGSQTGDLREAIAALKQTAQYASTFMGRISKAASQKGIDQGFQDLSATLAATRQASETAAKQLKGLPPDVLKQLSLQLGETLQTGETVLSNVQGKVGETATLLEQDLQHLRLLLIQLNSLVQSLKEQPNRLIFPSKEQPEPFKKK